jgi:sulfur-carrier protein
MVIRVHTIMGIKKIIGRREIDVPLPAGSTVRDLIDSMLAAYGESLYVKLFGAPDDSPFPHVLFMLNGRSIEFLQGMGTELSEGDEFLMLPIVGGG